MSKKETKPKKAAKTKAVSAAVPEDDGKAGRPTDYFGVFDKQAYKLCLLGATDKELAEFFECAESTLNLWKKKHPTFSESIKAGKACADMHLVEKLFTRAEGATVMQQQAIKVKNVQYEAGKKVSETEEVQVVELKQTLPPDTTALIFWLKNRRSTNWRDKQEHELTGKDGTPLVPTINLNLGAKS